jgi:hypothetical protein
VPLCAQWLEHPQAFGSVVAPLQQAIEAHTRADPDDDVALLHHRAQTLRRRVAALFFAPLLGIDTLTAFDTHAPPRPPLLGRSSQSATLRPCLGHLERIDAAQGVMPPLWPPPAGPIPSVDGHMMASWSRLAMPKGQSTMLGRSMTGSPASIAPRATGHGLVAESPPPDIHVSQGLVAYGQTGAWATGRSLVVIERAVTAGAMAWAFAQQGVGGRCRLDDNAHQGRPSFAAPLVDTLEDGPQVYRGPWKASRPAAPRDFVIVEPAAGQTLVSWGPPQGKDAGEVPQGSRGYRERPERQANRCKRMLAHGARTTNYGRQKSVGPDRPQQRAREQRDHAVQAAQPRGATPAAALKGPQAQGAEAVSKGHGKRLEQRQLAWVPLAKEVQDAQDTPEKLVAHAQALGPPRQRADRDGRPQPILTLRTLLLENALTSCMAVR